MYYYDIRSTRKDTLAVFSAPTLPEGPWAAPSRGDTASLPSHRYTLSYSFTATSITNITEGVRANLRMTQGFIETRTFYTSRENLDHQNFRLYSVDGTKSCKHHIRPFDQHLLFQAIEFSLLNVLYTKGITLTKYWKVGKLAFLQAPGQMMPYI